MSNEIHNIIKKLCNGNTDNLKNIPESYKKYLIKISELSIKNLAYDNNFKIDIALKILKTLDPFDESILDIFNNNLTKLQIDCIKYFNYVNSLLVAIPTGYGKTLIAIGITLSYLKKYPNHKVLVISPASVTKNFEKEGNKYGISFKKEKRIQFYSYDSFMNLNKQMESIDVNYNCENQLLIIDEAHTIRNPDGVRSKIIMKCALKSHKVLALTATPCVNGILDILPLVNVLAQRYIVITKKQLEYEGSKYIYTESFSRDKKNRIIKELKEFDFIKRFLSYHIIFTYKTDTVNFPTYKIIPTYIKMTDSYYKLYKDAISADLEINKIFQNPRVFYNGYRRAVNKIIKEYFSSKIYFMIDKIKDTQTIIYSNWIHYGADIIEKILNQYNIKYGIIKGDVNVEKRTELVNKFNKGEINVIVLTKAGSEGLDFKNTQNLLILDPTWGYSQTEQVVGRAVRYKSHIELPINKRHVNVYYLILVEPYMHISKLSDKIDYNLSKIDTLSGDLILYKISVIKESVINYVKESLNELSKETLKLLDKNHI